MPQSGACAVTAETAVPVEQLEMAIPQGYGLFIKTTFQASSFTEPLELWFQVQPEYLALSVSPSFSVFSSSVYLVIHKKHVPIPVGAMRWLGCLRRP